MGVRDDPVEGLPLCHRAAGKPHTEAVSQSVLYRAAKKRHQPHLRAVVLSQNLEKAEPIHSSREDLVALEGYEEVGVDRIQGEGEEEWEE